MEHGISFLRGKDYYLPKVNHTEPNQLIPDLPFEKYLEKKEALSSTHLRRILKSPRHYLAALIEPEEDTDYYRFGRAAHMMLLEPKKFRETYVVMPKFTGLTKDGRISERSADAKRRQEDWLANLPVDAIHITEEELEKLVGMAEALSAHDVSPILKKCKTEMTGVFTDPKTGIFCKIRPDILFEDEQGIHLFDYKTSSWSGSLSGAITNYRYHIQIAFYYYGLSIITGRPPHMAGFLFQEKEKPYQPDLVVCTEKMLEEGMRWVEHGLKTLKTCLDTNQWPFARTNAQMVDISDRDTQVPLPEFQFGVEE